MCKKPTELLPYSKVQFITIHGETMLYFLKKTFKLIKNLGFL